MIRHIAMLTLAAETTDAVRQEIVAQLRALPELIDTIRAYNVGVDLGLVENNTSIAVVAEFDTAEGWATYRSHPEHVRVLNDHIVPNLSSRTAIQYEL